jgi:hypothetical protein
MERMRGWFNARVSHNWPAAVRHGLGSLDTREDGTSLVHGVGINGMHNREYIESVQYRRYLRLAAIDYGNYNDYKTSLASVNDCGRPDDDLYYNSRNNLEPVQEVWIQRQRFDLVKRRSMMRTIARWIKAATVLALRHDHRSNFMADDFQKQPCFSTRRSPSPPTSNLSSLSYGIGE